MKFLNITENKQPTWTRQNLIFLELILIIYFILIVFVFKWQYMPGQWTGRCSGLVEMDRF